VSTADVLVPVDVDAATRQLFEAQRDRREIEPLTDAATFDERTAYEIQKKLVTKQVEHEGTRVVGLKLGLTSEAKQKQMSVHEPIYGVLLGSRYIGEGETLAVSSLIHPKIEPEIAVFTNAPLKGPGVTADQARKAIAFATPAMEVIDSRYKNFRFTLTDVIADNTSAARFAIASRRVAASSVDLRTVGVVFEKNGEVVTTAAGAAILGDPANAVAWLANKLAEHGESIGAGTTIMAGALTDAIAIAPGDVVTVTIAQLGSLTVRCV
jgi:2-oxo-3-hexenedioate decarboxylase